MHQALKVRFSGKQAQIEVGGPYVGIEMHHGSPLLNRISFFYPVANSIDLSPGYWQLDQYHVLVFGLQVGKEPKEWVGLESFEYELTPYSVAFQKRDSIKTIAISYNFCQNKSAMVARIEITNNAAESKLIEFYSHLEATLRTSHTYAHKDRAWSEYDSAGSTIYINYDDDEAGNPQMFVANAGEQPSSFTTNSETIGLPLADENWWMKKTTALPGEVIPRDAPRRPVAAYTYRQALDPGQKMTVVQVIGSCRSGEGKEMASHLLQNYRGEVESYEQSVLKKAYRDGVITTGDGAIDHSVHWAEAILAANNHYLDGEIVPMPCPAEYNFYFTHDVLLTDLAAVFFDLARVKQDLEYIVAHANPEGVIPHAYYWKDDRYRTEFAGPDNWNHFWFVLLAGSYLRHSQDTETLKALYPYIATSVRQVMSSKQEDDLLWANHPDWWDVGSSWGPRSYMTALAVRALREFIYISTALGENTADLLHHEALALRIQKQLNETLWDEELNYLINYYEDGRKDQHIYIGSLIAVHYQLVDAQKMTSIIKTAREKLLDDQLGVYNVFPMDFHLLIDYLKLKGDEAGVPYVYFNGGIWPHGNAWYALALIATDEKAEAARFIKRTMTLDGIIHSPNGQPAMYEFRNSNRQDASVYGKVDKSQFTWAAGWYLYSLYHLLGVRENEWNLAFDPYLLPGQERAQYSLFVDGKTVDVDIVGSGQGIKSITYDGQPYPSAVIPEGAAVKKIGLARGKPELPYLAATNSVLLSSQVDKKEKSLTLILKAFPGHRSKTRIVSPWKPASVGLNGNQLAEDWYVQQQDGTYLLEIDFSHRASTDTLAVRFHPLQP